MKTIDLTPDEFQKIMSVMLEAPVPTSMLTPVTDYVREVLRNDDNQVDACLTLTDAADVLTETINAISTDAYLEGGLAACLAYGTEQQFGEGAEVDEMMWNICLAAADEMLTGMRLGAVADLFRDLGSVLFRDGYEGEGAK